MPPRAAKPKTVVVPLEKMFEKPPPHSIEAEIALLGACILDPRVIDTAVGILPPNAFYNEAHQVVWAALLDCRAKGSTDLLLLHETLRDKDQLKDVGGAAYLQQLAQETPGPASAEHFAKIIADKAKLRELIKVSGEILYDAYNSDDANASSDRAMSSIMDACQTARAKPDISLGEAGRQVFEHLNAGKPQVWPTGIIPFDKVFGGFPKSQITIIIGAPNSGKTTFAIQALFNIASIDHVPVRMFSYEQEAYRIAATIQSQQARLQVHHRLNRGIKMSGQESAAMNMAQRELEAADFELCEEPLNAEGIFNRCRLYQERGVKIVAIDYLQLIPWIPTLEQTETAQINAACKYIRKIQRDLGLSVIVMSQPTGEASRASNDERGQARHIRLADGKGGQAIDATGDFGISIWRPHQNLRKPTDPWELSEWEAKVNEVQVVCVKGKYERRGMVPLRWHGEAMTFEDPSGQSYLPH